jgi:tetraacyldisaccharide 4'-kinase
VKDNPVVRAPLRFAAMLYDMLLRMRNRYYDRPSAPRRAPVPVVSVGNLTVGGTGKTPLVTWLASRLLDAGRKPAVVSRGYRGTAGRGPRVVSGGDGPTCGAEECGDEPYLLAESLPGLAVVVGRNRAAGAETAARLGCDVVILDDGFQHRRLARDLDIVLLDADSPFGNERLLPAGPLREPLVALARADLVLITRSHPDHKCEDIRRVVRRYNASVPILRADHRRIGFFDAAGRQVARPRRALVFCGIGNPGSFRSDVEAEGVEIVGFEPRRDHHRYDSSDLASLRSRASALDAALLTTEKDRVRLPSEAGQTTGPPVLTLRIETRPFEADRLDAAVHRALEAGPDR